MTLGKGKQVTADFIGYQLSLQGRIHDKKERSE
jgi:hypothetical protein